MLNLFAQILVFHLDPTKTRDIAKGTTDPRVEFISKFNFLTKPQLPNLQQIVAITILISNSYNINKFGVGIFTRQGDINQVY